MYTRLFTYLYVQMYVDLTLQFDCLNQVVYPFGTALCANYCSIRVCTYMSSTKS